VEVPPRTPDRPPAGSAEDAEILRPAQGLARRAEHPGHQLGSGDARPAALLLFADNLVPLLERRARVESLPFRAAQAPLWDAAAGALAFTVAVPGIGSPAAALTVEKLVAAGTRTVVGVGYAGSLAEGLVSGTRLVVEGAIGSDGTSVHYQKRAPGPTRCDDPMVVADSDLVAALSPLGDARGKVVSTGAPYRETRDTVRAWKARGALAVDMETAGLLAAARYRGARAASMLVLTDELAGDAWKPAPPGSVDGAAEKAIEAALLALRSST
jgi:uridine phosphorylase